MDVSLLLKMEEKMSHHSQHRFSTDSDETEPIIIVIDCSVQFLPLGNIHRPLHLSTLFKDSSVYERLPS